MSVRDAVDASMVIAANLFAWGGLVYILFWCFQNFGAIA